MVSDNMKCAPRLIFLNEEKFSKIGMVFDFENRLKLDFDSYFWPFNKSNSVDMVKNLPMFLVD